MGVSLRKCNPEMEARAQSGANGCKCNACPGSDKCEVAYFSAPKYGDKAVDAAKEYLTKINSNGKLARSMRGGAA